MKRRELLRLLGGAALACPAPVTAQPSTLPTNGYLSARSPQDAGHLVDAFRRGLGDGGFVEGQNVTIEYRWALGQYDRVPSMAAELVRRAVSVLASTGGEPAALAATGATSTIPIDWRRSGHARAGGEPQPPGPQRDWDESAGR